MEKNNRNRIKKGNYARHKKKKNFIIKSEEDKIVRCIGYLPDIRKFYIDREISGLDFKLYAYSRDRIEEYIRKKVRAKNKGFIT